jgi:hypothetical protein
LILLPAIFLFTRPILDPLRKEARGKVVGRGGLAVDVVVPGESEIPDNIDRWTIENDSPGMIPDKAGMAGDKVEGNWARNC